jgi:Arc/MetJ-type ribon-helix-helix transcriptional regulator
MMTGGADVANTPGGMTNCHTTEGVVPKTKVAVTIDAALVERVDALVSAQRFTNRSHAVEAALADAVNRLARIRLARACAKVDPREEQALAEEGFAGGVETWPEY